MDKETLDKFNAFIQENKGKRKFKQSVELAINFTGMDMSKQDNKINLEVKLPNGKGKEHKVTIFADDKNIVSKAQASGANIIAGSEIVSISTDKAKLNELLQNELLAQPSLMPQIARALGQFLGPRNKMPKPLIGIDVSTAVQDTAKSVYLRSKGKNLPTIHCMVGTESMDVNAIGANIDEVVNAVVKKVGRQHIRSVYAKLTMSKPMKIL
ncbi:MAG: 50S ribosomal protein L1 [Candidatus Micrarchaeaceae archaeon]|jgi:large subunit ribosomal protein L1